MTQAWWLFSGGFIVGIVAMLWALCLTYPLIWK